jgi:nucleoside phosphorylase
MTPEPQQRPKHLFMSGMAIGLPKELVFDVDFPCAGCRICGTVFQSDIDRIRDKTAMDMAFAIECQNNWREIHNKTHTDKEHLDLARSGMWATPEAAAKLATYGIIAVSDMVLYDDTAIALANAKAIPIDDVEGRI